MLVSARLADGRPAHSADRTISQDGSGAHIDSPCRPEHRADRSSAHQNFTTVVKRADVRISCPMSARPSRPPHVIRTSSTGGASRRSHQLSTVRQPCLRRPNRPAGGRPDCESHGEQFDARTIGAPEHRASRPTCHPKSSATASRPIPHAFATSEARPADRHVTPSPAPRGTSRPPNRSARPKSEPTDRHVARSQRHEEQANASSSARQGMSRRASTSSPWAYAGACRHSRRLRAARRKRPSGTASAAADMETVTRVATWRRTCTGPRRTPGGWTGIRR